MGVRITNAKRLEVGAGLGGVIRIGISSETDRLRTAAMWGKPGPEAVLAQLYPKNVSLFLDSMDVVRAGVEIEGFATLLREEGVKVIEVKEELAKVLSEPGLTKNKIMGQLLAKARTIEENFGAKGQSKAKIEEAIVNLLERDIEEHGEQGALALVKALCLNHQLPLSNIIYSRDQTNVVLDYRIVSYMAEPIRVPEVELYERVYGGVLGLNKTIQIPRGERFEGGDLYMHNNTVYIGVGARTSVGAALQIFKELSVHKGISFVLVYDNTIPKSFEEIQESMHLDTFSMPIGPKQMAVCEQEASRRRVSVVKVNAEGDTEIKPTRLSFMGYLEKVGYDLLVVTKEEQTTFGCNLLVLDKNSLFMPVDHAYGIIKMLRGKGKQVEFVPFNEVTNGFGATHCAVAQLLRA
jgi:arginine deiminase